MSTEPAQTIDATPVETTQEAAPAPVETPAPQETPPPQPEKPKNRTGEYIQRLQAENRELRQLRAELDALKAAVPKNEPKPPSPDEFYQDPAGWTQRNAQFTAQQAVTDARKQWEADQATARQQAEYEAQAAAFREKSATFAAEHPDFEEVLYSVPEDLLPEDLARTIIGHERGVELAYHLGNHLGELAVLASVAPHLRQYRLNELVSRLDGESRTTAPPPEAPSPVAALVQPQKPISQAPAPAPRVGGRTPTEVPPEKMTDDEWYKQDMERRRKR